MPMPGIDLTNQFLIAMPGMGDDRFTHAVVYLCEHSPKGALGVVVNKPVDLTVQDLFQKVELPLDSSALAQQPVYFGGPVQPERGFVLHEHPPVDGPAYASTLEVPGGLSMTTSKDVLEAISTGGGPKRVLIALGYSGWGAGQLEDELTRNSWLSVAADPEVIFNTPVELRYQRALGLLGVDVRMLSQDVGHA